MRALVLGLVAAAAAAVPATAQDGSIVFGRFQQFCAPAVGGWQKALDAADAEGWAVLPADDMTEVGGDVTLSKGGARVMVKDRRMFMLIAGETVYEFGKFKSRKARVCGIMAFTAETAKAQADVRGLLGTAPASEGFENDEDVENLQVWAWSGAGGRREFYDDVESSKAERAFRRGDFTALMVGEDTGVTAILQMQAIK